MTTSKLYIVFQKKKINKRKKTQKKKKLFRKGEKRKLHLIYLTRSRIIKNSDEAKKKFGCSNHTALSLVSKFCPARMCEWYLQIRKYPCLAEDANVYS